MKWLSALPGEVIRASLLVVALGCAVLGVLGWVAYFEPRLDFIANLAPVALVAALFVGLVWLAQAEPRKPLSTGPLALIAIVAWSAFILPDVAQRLLAKRVPAQGETLKVVQFNVWEEGWSNDRKLAWIKSEDPDVILLEEVGLASSQLTSELVKTYPHITACYLPSSSCAIMILSKRAPVAQGSSNAKNASPKLAWARYRSAGGEYVVAATHFSWPLPDGRQRRQVDQLVEMLKPAKSDSLVLGGDFNASPWSFPIRRLDKISGLTRLTRALPTYPAKQVTNMRLAWPIPILPIDHIYAGPRWRTVSLKRGPDLGSDHYPVVAVLVRDKPTTGNVGPETKKRLQGPPEGAFKPASPGQVWRSR